MPAERPPGSSTPQRYFHDTRHTCASWIINNGGTLFDVQTVPGHSRPVETNRYAHLCDEHLQDVVSRVDEAFAAADQW